MHANAKWLIPICAMALAGCADINSISRRSNLPSSTTVDGRALHLDAKQRVVLAKAGTRDGRVDMACAEPSPDALSAFASSVGGGISVSGQGAGSAASALSEAAASIGLRTQSITLMRDALYRVCEAYYNCAISEPQAMALLSRSQDLTAAVVSIEQLTGAIVAKQAALGGAADASASAALLSNTQALAKMRELRAQYAEEATKLEAENKTAVGERKRVDGEIATKRTEVSAAPPEEKSAREAELADLESQREGFDAEAIRTQSQLDLKREQIADMDKAITATAAQLDSATTSATASAASDASLSGGSVVSRLDKDTAQAISTAVVSITNSVINKSYISTECMALLTAANLELGSGGDATKLACIKAIEARALAEAEIARAEQLEAKQRGAMIENAPLQLGP